MIQSMIVFCKYDVQISMLSCFAIGSSTGVASFLLPCCRKLFVPALLAIPTTIR